MIRVLGWLATIACLVYVFFFGGKIIAVVFGAVALVILALAEIDEHMTGHRGVSGSFKRTDKLAKR